LGDCYKLLLKAAKYKFCETATELLEAGFERMPRIDCHSKVITARNCYGAGKEDVQCRAATNGFREIATNCNVKVLQAVF